MDATKSFSSTPELIIFASFVFSVVSDIVSREVVSTVSSLTGTNVRYIRQYSDQAQQGFCYYYLALLTLKTGLLTL